MLDALKNGYDFVYVHVEAPPDECGHRGGEVDNKVLAIELIDERVVKPIIQGLEAMDDDYRVLVMPDHPTPIAYRTHTSSPVPYALYDSRVAEGKGLSYDEFEAEKKQV